MNNNLNKLLQYLYGTMNDKNKNSFLEKYTSKDGIVPLDLETAISNPGFKDIFNAGLGAVKSHPYKSLGAGALALGNIGGLTDNDKFGGQLGGLALGGIGSALAGVSPYTATMLTMGGGELGALFDKLRAKKEQEQSYPYYGK